MGSEGLVVFWKGLEMSQRCLGVPRGSPGVRGVLQRSPMGIWRTTSQSNTFSLVSPMTQGDLDVEQL